VRERERDIQREIERKLYFKQRTCRQSRLLNLKVSFAKEPYKRDNILPKKTYTFKEPTIGATL